jgi:hypothetical protein
MLSWPVLIIWFLVLSVGSFLVGYVMASGRLPRVLRLPGRRTDGRHSGSRVG